MEKKMAEDATGIRENLHGIGTFYDENGKEISTEKIKDHKAVEVPNAGAGSYQEVFETMGYPHLVKVFMCSSAGDWSFIVSKDRKEWFEAWQENRYPYVGFRYGVSDCPRFASKVPVSDEDALKIVSEIYEYREY